MPNRLKEILNRFEEIRSYREEKKKAALKLWVKRAPQDQLERFEDFLADTKLSWLEPIRKQAAILGEVNHVPTELLRDGAATIVRSVQKQRFQEETYEKLTRQENPQAWKVLHRYLSRASYDDNLKSRSRIYFDEDRHRYYGQHAVTCAEVVGKICQVFTNHYFGRDPGSTDVPFIQAVAAFHLCPFPSPSRKSVQKIVTEWRRGECWRRYPWIQTFAVDGVKELLEENKVTVDLDYILCPIEKMQKSKGIPVPDGEYPREYRVPRDDSHTGRATLKHLKGLWPIPMVVAEDDTGTEELMRECQKARSADR